MTRHTPGVRGPARPRNTADSRNTANSRNTADAGSTAALNARAAVHAALGDPGRLAIIEDLTSCDRTPGELRRRHGMESNLLTHHLDLLESVGLIERHRSSGDGRRRYVHLRAAMLAELGRPVSPPAEVGEVWFLCTANSARSQLAAALWTARTGRPARSAGTDPAPAVHPGAIAAARRHGIDLESARPAALSVLGHTPTGRVITVCDRAHEELEASADAGDWLHWSVPDPVPSGSARAFDTALTELDARIQQLLAAS